MRESKESHRQAEKWKQKAEEDLEMAVALLKTRRSAFAGGVCFHVQQAVEKYLKAHFVLRGVDFRKTRNVAELVRLLPASAVPDLSPNEQDRLSEYAVVTRYPGEYDSISTREAEEALHIARRVQRFFRKKMAEER
jgi:HEPN domain-containing protein